MCKMKHRAFRIGYVYGMIVSNIYTHCGNIALPVEWFTETGERTLLADVRANIIPSIKLYFKADNPGKCIDLECHYNESCNCIIVEYTIKDEVKKYTVSELETLLGHKIEIVAEELK